MTPASHATRLHAAALVVAGLLATGTGCGLGDADGDFGGPPPATVELFEVRTSRLNDMVTFSGQFSAEHSVMIKPESDGVIAEVSFEEGGEVEKGQILFRLKDDEQVARLREAQATLALANEVYSRAQKLLTAAAASQAKRDEAAAELAVARSRVELARVEFERTRIKAPFDGVAGLRMVDPGDRVDEDTPLVQIDAVDRLQLSFAISEIGILFTRVGTPVVARVAPYPDETFPGEVFFVSPTLDPSNRRIIAKAWVPNPDRRLRAGLFAEVDMQVAQRDEAILVPETAVVFDRRGTYVWRVDAENVPTKVPVETGLRKDGRVEVTLGLQPGDRIVSAGVHKVQEGEQVFIADSAAPAVSGQALRTEEPPAGDGA